MTVIKIDYLEQLAKLDVEKKAFIHGVLVGAAQTTPKTDPPDKPDKPDKPR